jgi:lipopolysaccharide transport system permease protein
MNAPHEPVGGGRAAEEIIIRPRSSWLRLDLVSVWRYRDLLLLMVRRDFVSRFKQTILGPLWFFINPIITTLVFTVIFGKVANLSTDGLPQPLFYNSGLLMWNYFAGLLTITAGTFTGNAGMFGKVYFPRLVVPLANAVSALFSLAIQFATFLGFFVYFRISAPEADFSMSPWVPVLLPLIVLQSAAIALGVGFWLAALTTRYRDLSHMTGFVVQLWMYGTPVIYPLSKVPEQWHWLAAANPVTAVVEGTRILLLGRGTLEPTVLAVSIATTLVVLVSGMFAFQKAERTFVDTV